MSQPAYLRYAAILVLLVFVAEAIIMLAIPALVPEVNGLALAVLDAGVLVLVLGPFMLALERRRARVEAEARHLAAVVEHSDDPIVSATPDGVIMSWNPAAERLSGYTAVEAIGTQGILMLPPDRRAEMSALLERVRQGEAIRHHETPVVRKDGTPFHAWLSLAPLRDGGGKVIGISIVVRDISERRQDQEAQAALIHRLQATLQQVRQLSGLLPICASCKRIRDKTGGWTQLEAYIRERSEAEFSHGICPTCAAELYGDSTVARDDSHHDWSG